MAHWKKLMDPKEFLFAHDLEGRDVVVEFEHVTGGELEGDKGRKTKKPIAKIAGRPKKLALNATNCKTIEQLYGTPDVDKWKGIRVQLFPTTTQFGGETKDCIRIRPFLPKSAQNGKRGDEPSKPAADPDADLLDDDTSDEGSDAAV